MTNQQKEQITALRSQGYGYATIAKAVGLGLDEEKQILLDTPAGRLTFAQKAAATVRPVVDMSGIENVDLSE